MLKKIRKTLLKSKAVRSAVADHQRRAKEAQRKEYWTKLLRNGGAIRD